MSNIDEIKKSWKDILERSKESDYIVVVGASSGTDMQSFLMENNILISEYFDNSELFVGTDVNGTRVSKPYKVNLEKVLYIISAKSEKNQEALKQQLHSLEIESEHIETVPVYKSDVDKLPYMTEEEMLEEISNYYTARMGKIPNLENPTSYTEKVNASKIYMGNERCTLLADKYLVKEFIKNELGEKYVVPLFGVWENAEDINYDSLPDKFVLKVNNASGRNILVKNKKELNIEETNKQLNAWLKENYGYVGFSLQYRGIQPRIICEEYLDELAESVYDYQFFCFHGEPRYIWCINGSHRAGCRAAFYDLDWNMQPFSFGYPKDDIVAPKPSKLEEMIEISKKLSKGFEHVRVDLYEMPDGRLLFGEMTFQTWGGCRRFYPPEYDYIMGKMFDK